MLKLIPGFQHWPGIHCGSTSLRNVAMFYKRDLSEAMCFGLGSGLGFLYVEDSRNSPSRHFQGRCYSLEPVFFAHIGYPLNWKSEARFSWLAMREALDRGHPVICLTDIFYLDYFQTSHHFSGHAVVLAGYGEDVVLVADTGRTELQLLPVKSLERAMYSSKLPYPVNYQWMEVDDVPDFSFPEAIARALVDNAEEMLNPRVPNYGLPAMERWATSISNWPEESEDWAWCARFGYQVIMRRGTDGGNFRFLYSDFLRQAEALIPAVNRWRAAEKMYNLGQMWRALGLILREISEHNDPSGFSRAQNLATYIFRQEESYYQGIRSILA